MNTDRASIDQVVGRLEGALAPLVAHAAKVDEFIEGTHAYRLEDQAMHAQQTAELKELIAAKIGAAQTGVMSSIGALEARLVPLEADLTVRGGRASRKRQAAVKVGALAAGAAALHECWGWIRGAAMWALTGHR